MACHERFCANRLRQHPGLMSLGFVYAVQINSTVACAVACQVLFMVLSKRNKRMGSRCIHHICANRDKDEVMPVQCAYVPFTRLLGGAVWLLISTSKPARALSIKGKGQIFLSEFE